MGPTCQSSLSLHLLSSSYCRTTPQCPAPAATAPAVGPRRPRHPPAVDARPGRRTSSRCARRGSAPAAPDAGLPDLPATAATSSPAPGRKSEGGSSSPPRRSWSGLELARRGLPSRARARSPARRCPPRPAARRRSRRSRRSGRKKRSSLRPPNFSGRSRPASQLNIRFWVQPNPPRIPSK